ncbi:MAG: 3,4-dihydroxy-2-butanone-4-phosphate synthase, partial [Thermoprotei archaeon]
STSFSLWVNHKDTFTGVTDRDRALTIRKIGEAVEKSLNGGKFNFFNEFISPGHVALLRAADGLIYERKGHTELSIALAEMAGITPAVAICEMLDEKTGGALSKLDAMRYAEENKIPFVEGIEIVKAYKKTKSNLIT